MDFSSLFGQQRPPVDREKSLYNLAKYTIYFSLIVITLNITPDIIDKSYKYYKNYDKK